MEYTLATRKYSQQFQLIMLIDVCLSQMGFEC